MNLIERLTNTNDILLHYAPLHSMLAEWGKPLEDHLSEWIVNNPKAYQEAIVKSLEAGCDFVSTSTQASSPWRAEIFGLRDKVYELNYMSAKLAREVVPSDRYLLGMVSSTNPDFLQPIGNLTEQEVYDGYKEQISALLEGGIDVFLIAGNHPDETAIGIRVAKDLSDLPIISQNIYYITKTGFRTMMGHTPATGTAVLKAAGADVIGGSCGLMRMKTLETVKPGESNYYPGATKLVAEIRKSYDGFISIQPNAGLAQVIDNETNYPASPDELKAEVLNWVEAGARIVGGCCGTNLDHYRAIYPVIKEYNIKNK